jgi:hypothetical protein
MPRGKSDIFLIGLFVAGAFLAPFGQIINIHVDLLDPCIYIYDLTEWRQKRASNEKADKEYIMDTYPTKERLATFVQTELSICSIPVYTLPVSGLVLISTSTRLSSAKAVTPMLQIPRMFFKVAIGVISTAGGLLGSLYWLHTKRRGFE